MSIYAGRLSRKNFGLGFLLMFGVLFFVGMFAAIIFAPLSSARLKGQEAQIQLEANQQNINDTIQQAQSPEPSQTTP